MAGFLYTILTCNPLILIFSRKADDAHADRLAWLLQSYSTDSFYSFHDSLFFCISLDHSIDYFFSHLQQMQN
ncbi:MAG TPA: hypothetical protein DCL40_04390 [Coxiellaceae bacterium]|nr:hypothetical protein [Coxiellaceae bacterium]